MLPSRHVSRRTLLVAGLATMTVPALSSCSGTGGGARRPVTAPDDFSTPLAVPLLDEGTLVSPGVREFALTAREGTHDMGTGVATPTWGFNGDHLGPTLRARSGETVRVRVTNDLPEETTVHWHGMHLPAVMDGGPHQMIEPGGTWEPAWTIDQPAASLWYHPHPHGATEEHVYRGLAGMFWIDPDEGPDTRLPHRYGIDDVPVVVQDKRLDDDGELDLDDQGLEIGLLGDRVLANGTWGGHVEASTELLRLRLLNGSTARTYGLGFSDDRDFDVVATDGGLLERPVATTRVRLSPGERAEVVVRLAPAERVRLVSYGAELGDVVIPSVFGADDVIDVLEIRARDRLEPSPPLPEVLTSIERLDPSAADARREWELEGREINGQGMDMDRVDATVTAGALEQWTVRSRNPYPHNFHVHDVQFRVVAVDGAPPPPLLAGLKDTVYLEPHVSYDLLMRFGDHADPEHPYMFHCHLLLHEDDGMMGQFVVVDDGDAADLSGHEGH